MTPTDPLYRDQWHFALLGDIEAVWDDYTGDGVLVGVYDDGIEYDHPDLDGNYDPSAHFENSRTVFDPYPIGRADSHGTSVAGIIAAEAGNGLGGVGVAPGASLSGVNLLVDLEGRSLRLQQEALLHASAFDVMSNSWGPEAFFLADFSLTDPRSTVAPEIEAFAHATESGRDGLGTIIVHAAGNASWNHAGDGLSNAPSAISVGAIDEDGFVPAYSNHGAGLLVTAPAAAVTTDLAGAAGENDGNTSWNLRDADYTNTFDGTSAATPVVSGVVALILDADPGLGWRDVHEILAVSAAQTGADYGGPKQRQAENGEWLANGADTWNGGGLTWHQSYGFGAVDAHAAVRMAEVWATMHGEAATSSNALVASGAYDGPVIPIPDVRTVTAEASVSENVAVETVMVRVKLTHDFGGDLVITLVAPDGTEIVLMDEEIPDTAMSEGFDWLFKVSGLRGTDSEGTWTLRVEDTAAVDTGILETFSVEVRGGEAMSDDVHHLTDDFGVLRAVESERRFITDENGGNDWLNLAAVTRNIAFDADTGGSIGGAEMIADGSIENFAAGDGRDSITGNAADNRILGGRGHDRLLGGGGDDTIEGDAGNDFLRGDEGDDDVQGGAGDDEIYAGADDTGDDTVSGGAGDDVAAGGAGSDTIITTSGSDTLYGGAGNDRILQEGVDPTGAGDLVWAGSGADTVTLGGGADTIGGGEGDDALMGGAGDDIFYGGRDGGADTIHGDGGADTVYAGVGNDAVFGGTGDDAIFNGEGTDTVEGGEGADSLYGSPGDDRLSGDGAGSASGGADTFLFFADSGDDVVSDFEIDVDKIAFYLPFAEISFGANDDGDAFLFTDEMSATFPGLTVSELNDPTLFV